MPSTTSPSSNSRNSVFEQWQPEYAARGIATFPVHETKRPAIRGWQKVGLKASAALAGKKAADAFGYVTGRRAKVTVLDIDTTDEEVSEDAIGRHGQPGIVVRTASGKWHHLYGYNGEGRRIRPWPDLPIDVLGDNGYVLAPPSKLEKGSYEIVHGHLDDLDRLKPMVGAPQLDSPLPAKWTGMRQGDGRNRALWERCMRTGAGCSLDRMMEIARNANQSFKEPLMDTEIVKIATSAWQHDAAGLNFFTRPRVMLNHDVVDALTAENPDAVALLVVLERYHGGNDRFILANEMASKMGWGLFRWRSARDLLIKSDIIRCLYSGGRGPNDPPIYGWVLKG
jgi:Bifunctional DNA primase/polymerase, N-terminal